jgi:hypothetical protein
MRLHCSSACSLYMARARSERLNALTLAHWPPLQLLLSNVLTPFQVTLSARVTITSTASSPTVHTLTSPALHHIASPPPSLPLLPTAPAQRTSKKKSDRHSRTQSRHFNDLIMTATPPAQLSHQNSSGSMNGNGASAGAANGGGLKVQPLLCSGHTRPVTHLQFSNLCVCRAFGCALTDPGHARLDDGSFLLISSCKDGNPMLRSWLGDWVGTFLGPFRCPTGINKSS